MWKDVLILVGCVIGGGIAILVIIAILRTAYLIQLYNQKYPPEFRE